MRHRNAAEAVNIEESLSKLQESLSEIQEYLSEENLQNVYVRHRNAAEAVNIEGSLSKLQKSLSEIQEYLSEENLQLFRELKHNTLLVCDHHFSLLRLVYNTLLTKHKDHISPTPYPDYERLWDEFIETYKSDDFTDHDEKMIQFLDQNRLTLFILFELNVSSYQELLVKLNESPNSAIDGFRRTFDAAFAKKLALDKIQKALAAPSKSAPEAELLSTGLL